MNELLTALVAATKVGFDAPKCSSCEDGEIESGELAWGYPCANCHATGLDASDPERLIGRALRYLIGNDWTVIQGPFDTIAHPWMLKWPDENAGEKEPHDGTPAGLATALLRLVARVGGAA